MQRTIQLFRGTGQSVSANICTMTDEHVYEFQMIWDAMLVEAEQKDEGWGWAYKLRQSEQEDRFEAYALVADQLAQGLLFIETQWHRSQLDRSRPLIYVKAIATAPWNRKQLEDPPFFQNVGKTLMLFSRRRSVELGYEGRVGLHALPGVEGFYQRIGMPEYEADIEKDGLIYFEHGTV